ncbi:MAG: DNA repair protein RecN [Solobacterium sp.]|nr:DNA repair protein RecN [Solobacterium sp.]
MLRHLYIKNFVLIDELNLDFHDGFSAFIGETGAGKSILIDAVSLLGADRASSSYISKGKDRAIVEGTFDLSSDPNALARLKEAGFETEGDVTFTREILSSGKSTARIDHRIVTLSLMRSVLEYEIDIHGQRDNQYLLNTATHIHLLDEYLQNDALRKKTADAYHVWKALCEEKQKALEETFSESDLEFFRHEIDEIDAADLKEGEEEELSEKERSFKAVKSSFEKLNEVIRGYDESLSGEMYEMNHTVQSLEDSELFQKAKESMNDAYYIWQDAVELLRNVYDSMEFSEEEINRVEERLFLLQRMKRRYGPTVTAILERREELQKQVDRFSRRDEFLREIDQKIDSAYQTFSSFAEKISRQRRKGSTGLDQAVAGHLKDLMLEKARFKTDIRSCEPNENGTDRVEFMIAMNRGEDFRPLSKTASGGELSRLMLGLKVIFTHLQGIQTVIFDEIDTGVSGPVASAIGRKMRELSMNTQVFAVTHLAPVAATAQSHYAVSKSEEQGRTHTHVKELQNEEVLAQLAVIASGEVTETSLAAAKELYERNQRQE